MQSKKYIPFSEQDRLMASKVDLVSFLQLRGEKLERVGKEYKLIYTDVSGKHDSITVCGNRSKPRCGQQSVLEMHSG